MRVFFYCYLILLTSGFVWAQPASDQLAKVSADNGIKYTHVKNQAASGTCWSFSVTSLIESQTILHQRKDFDLSEMYTVRNIYREKASNYLLRQGAAQFGPGGLGHDVLLSVEKYGVVPESVYSGLLLGVKAHDHTRLDQRLKGYLDSLLRVRPLPADWRTGFEQILDDQLGKVPEKFTFREKVYTPQSFSKEVIGFKQEDYASLTSFTHHPFFQHFILEVPDNYANGEFFNVPLNDLISIVERAIANGYTVMWDADVSNTGFRQDDGYALQPLNEKSSATVNPEMEERPFDQQSRQLLFENLTTQDDHLMHIVGMEKTGSGKKLFVVKNSWGEIGPFKGFIKVSVPYFAINTISVVLPKEALPDQIIAKMKRH
jgi:bleomycin hydrolase